jgi:hypothetical protein
MTPPLFLSCDASVLVAELLHPPFRALLRSGALRLLVAEHHWEETLLALETRVQAKLKHNALPATAAQGFLSSLAALPEQGVIDVVPHDLYAPHEALARLRIPRDPRDWPAVAVAITFGVGILTNDKHFLGCGCVTWTMETLRAELAGEAGSEEATSDEESPAVTVPWLTALDGATPLPEEPVRPATTTPPAVPPFAAGFAGSSGTASATLPAPPFAAGFVISRGTATICSGRSSPD